MRSRHIPRGPVSPQMNVTPLIDVVFLLIVFFMLINNTDARQWVQMMLPRVNNSSTHVIQKPDRIVVNITAAQGDEPGREAHPLAIAGRPGRIKVGARWFAADDLAGVTAALTKARRQDPKLHVLVRADAALYYQAVAPVLQAVANAGIAKVDLAAYTKK